MLVRDVQFERLREHRVSPHKRGVPGHQPYGPLVGLVPGARLTSPRFELRRLVNGAPVGVAVAAHLCFELRRLVNGAPVGVAVDDPPIERRWPALACTPFEWSGSHLAGRVLIMSAVTTRFTPWSQGESIMSPDEVKALKGAHVTLEGRRREIVAVREIGANEYEFDIRPPIVLAAPTEVFERLDVKGEVTVIADTQVRFRPDDEAA